MEGKIEGIKHNPKETFPSFLNSKKISDLLEKSFYEGQKSSAEYAQSETVETQKYVALILNYLEHFEDENGKSVRQILDVVFKIKNQTDEVHTNIEYFKVFTPIGGGEEDIENDEEIPLFTSNKLLVEQESDDVLIISLLDKDDENRILAKFSVNMASGGEIKRINVPITNPYTPKHNS